MRVLLTNDDGIEADGLQALRRALLRIPGIELAVVAPDGNRSAMARSITTRRPLWVEEVDFGDGTVGYATDGTPVDCVRFAKLGLIEGFEADVIVAGINHGSNLGDDITYSGTVAAALEGVVLGLPAVAVSQQSAAREMDFRLGERFDFEAAAASNSNCLPSRKSISRASDCCETAIAGSPSTIPSIAAATVPEYEMSSPRLEPWLMPETISSASKASTSPSAAKRTQSTGVPSVA